MPIRKVLEAGVTGLPFLIIASLLYAGLFVKPTAAGASVPATTFSRNDAFYGIATPSDRLVWTAGRDGKVLFSADDGASWVIQRTPTKVHLQDIAAWDPEHAVAVGNKGVIVFTNDGGKAWQVAEAPQSALANKLLRVRVFAGGEAWAVGESGVVLRTSDFGRTWVATHKAEDIAWNDVWRSDAGSLLVGEFGKIKRSRDGGANWEDIASPVKSSLMSVAFRDARNGIAVGLSGVVLATRDGGQTWVREQSSTPEHLFDVTWSGAAWIAVGDKGALLRGDPAGDAWTPLPQDKRSFAWHTAVKARGGSAYLAGADLMRVREREGLVLSR
jgi:photosystem II stability/assembly factor-like uncharacterized protein